MNRLLDLQQKARSLSGTVEIIEQLRAQLLCNRIDERSLQLGMEGVLREARDGELRAEVSSLARPRSALRRSRIDQVQLRMDALLLRSQARISDVQARIHALYTAGHGSPDRLGAVSGSR